MSPLTRFGLQIPSFTYGQGEQTPGDDQGLFGQVASIATTAESAGFDSIWVMDHLFQIPGIGETDEPMFEAYTLLGGLAARTRGPGSAPWSPVSPTGTPPSWPKR